MTYKLPYTFFLSSMTAMMLSVSSAAYAEDNDDRSDYEAAYDQCHEIADSQSDTDSGNWQEKFDACMREKNQNVDQDDTLELDASEEENVE